MPEDISPTHVTARLGQEIRLVPVTDIVWIEARGHHLALYTSGEVLLARATMKGATERLANAGFLRVSRHALVNVEAIAAFVQTDAKDHVLVLKNGQHLTISRKRWRTVRSRFQL